MNLHGTVRGAITTINPDVWALYLSSTGPTVNADYSTTPTYAPPQRVKIQVQPPGSRELQHIEKLNLTGVFRVVFLYGNAQGVVRILAQGGDLLVFRPFNEQAPQTWKVVEVDGPWNVEQGGWTKLLVQLQADYPLPVPLT